MVLEVNTGIVPLNWQLATLGGAKEGEDEGEVASISMERKQAGIRYVEMFELDQ